MRFLTVIFAFAFLQTSLGLFAQSPTIDSLNSALVNCKSKLDFAQTKNTLAEELIFIDTRKGFTVLREAHSLIRTTTPIDFKTELKRYYRVKGDIYNNMAYLFAMRGQNNISHLYIKAAIAIYKNTDASISYAISLNNYGQYLDKKGDLIDAMEYYSKSLSIFEKEKDVAGIALLTNNIGNAYVWQEDYTKGLELLTRSLEAYHQIGDSVGKTNAILNVAAANEYLRNFKLALWYYNRAMEIQRKLNDPHALSIIYNDIGNTYRKMGKSNKALEYLLKSSTYSDSINDIAAKANTLNNIAAIYLDEGEIKLAKKTNGIALAMGLQVGEPKSIKFAYRLKSDILRREGNYKEALEAHQKFKLFSDSLVNEQTHKTVYKQQAKYEFYQKEILLKAEQEKHDIEQRDKLKQQKIITISVVAGFIMLVAFSLFMYNRFKITQKQKLIIEKQKKDVDIAYEQLHEKNQEITDSIIYARRIQRALMPTEKYISATLKRLKK